MALQLRDNLHWCACDGRALFLDVEADRYFCLPGDANETFIRLAAGETEQEGAEGLEMLVERGLLVEGGAAARIPPPPVIDPPGRDFAAEPRHGAALSDLLQALLAETLAARRLRTRPFGEVLETARRRALQAPAPSSDHCRPLEVIVAAAARLALVTRAHDRCLARALAVHSRCTRIGVRPALVLGVIAHPFAAHCWVQLRSDVLVGGFEQARLYTPILVIA